MRCTLFALVITFSLAAFAQTSKEEKPTQTTELDLKLKSTGSALTENTSGTTEIEGPGIKEATDPRGRHKSVRAKPDPAVDQNQSKSLEIWQKQMDRNKPVRNQDGSPLPGCVSNNCQ